ncbi:MAG TPA: DinB family protein [Methylomirabilota bacterium]|nr:DinB family protein [Methylomirabilota bacterium]
MNADAEAQERARAYFRSKSTLAPAVLRGQIAAAFEALDTVLATVPPDRAARRTIANEWSIQEIVDHLLETYRPGVDELRCLLAGQRPPGEPIPASLQSKAPLLRPWPWLLDELRRAHRDVLDLLAGVPEDCRTAARAPFVMVVNVPGPGGAVRPLHWVEEADWKAYALASWRLHPIDHLNQARKVLAAGR